MLKQKGVVSHSVKRGAQYCEKNEEKRERGREENRVLNQSQSRQGPERAH